MSTKLHLVTLQLLTNTLLHIHCIRDYLPKTQIKILGSIFGTYNNELIYRIRTHLQL